MGQISVTVGLTLERFGIGQISHGVWALHTDLTNQCVGPRGTLNFQKRGESGKQEQSKSRDEEREEKGRRKGS
jgi:hypothetical protein